jgi:uncharacterized LabA/DUF88 family protein
MLNAPTPDSRQLRSYPDRTGRDYFGPGRCIMMIDGAGIHDTLRVLNADIDYLKLRQLFVGEIQLVRAIYYALTGTEEEAFGLRRLLEWLDHNGYVIREKPIREFTDANGSRIQRGRVSLQMAVDALEMTALIDHLIIFSGDVDLVPLVRAVKRRGVCVTVVSTLAVKPPIIANELRRQVDRFVDMRELMPLIQLRHP